MTDERPNAALSVIDYLADSGGVLAPVVGKVAAKALTDFVGHGMAIPAAWLGGIAQGIKDDADARSLIKRSIAERAAELASADPALVDRMANRWLGQQIKHQANIEGVAELAIEDLRANPSTSDEQVNEAFLDRLAKYSESASDEHLRLLFARILAGEIRGPGRFSLTTLHIASLLDQSTAQAIATVSNWTINDRILRAAPYNAGEPLDKIGRAQDLGLIRAQELTFTSTNPNKFYRFAVRGGEFLAEFDEDKNVRFVANALTPAGRELFSIVDSSPSVEERRTLAKALLTSLGADRVYFHPDNMEVGHRPAILAERE